MMEYEYNEKKAVIVLASNIEVRTALNIAGHLSIALGNKHTEQEIMGRPYLKDADGIDHNGISRYPVIVTKVKQARLKKLIEEVREQHPDLFMSDYPEDMLLTKHDDELAESLAAKSGDSIKYLGVLLFGNVEELNSLTGKFTLWN